ncbi:MAG: signal peptidase I [Bacteroidia bacterium]|nr:MAG: signal peptidase I [Bacteroidia bacterium]
MERLTWKYLGFGLTALLWSLLVIWVELWYLLVFDLVLFDLTVTRKFDWTLRKFGLPRYLQSTIEWLFIVLLALASSLTIKVLFVETYKIPTPSMEETLLAGDFIFVSKLAYGPRLPETPLAIPFYHNKLPSGKKSYSEKLKMPHKRLKGFSSVERDDIIVFNFPAGDTMVLQYPGQNYYSLVRQYGREYIRSEFDIITHPVDKRENYIKRCIALPGDTLQIRGGQIQVNGKTRPVLPHQKFKYYVTTNGDPLPDPLLDSLKILKTAVTYNPVNSLHVLYLAQEHVETLKSFPQVRSIKQYSEPTLSFQNQEIFPHDPHYRWTGDNFGPLMVPAKGDTLQLDMLNLPLYQRLISTYEHRDLQIVEGEIFIDGEPADSYVVQLDYFFVMGDNRHNSADSRYWGFVPEDHLLGKAVAVWFSIEPEKRIIGGLRKERIFRSIK